MSGSYEAIGPVAENVVLASEEKKVENNGANLINEYVMWINLNCYNTANICYLISFKVTKFSFNFKII